MANVIQTLIDNETSNTTYPVTLTKAVYDEDGNRLDNTLSEIEGNIPTKTSDLTNDSGFITKSVNNLDNYTKTSDLSEVATSGDYDDLTNKPSIPTKTSDITNDSGYITKAVNDLTNYRTSSAQDVIDEDMQDAIDAIEELIPTQATSSNQLADKNFVNSSIATETAHYISNNGQPFASVEQLEAYSGTVTNNDYAIVTGVDASGNTYFDRYKATVPKPAEASSIWAKEYRINNSSFTAVQWAAINSGVTSALVASYNAHIASTSNPHSVTKAQVGLGNVDNTSDADKPISTATQTALTLKEDTSNKVTSFGTTPSDTKYPSEKLVKDSLDAKAELPTIVNDRYLHTNSQGELEWGEVQGGSLMPTYVTGEKLIFTNGATVSGQKLII